MATGVTLGEMVKMLRAEIGASTDQQMGINQVDPLQLVLRRQHDYYFRDFDWPQFKIDDDEQLEVGERYYTFNDPVDYSRIFEAWVQTSTNLWTPLAYGITPMDYNAFNSDFGVQNDPILKWQHYGENQFEVWPIPSVARKIRFRCIRKPSQLTASTDKSDLDADMLVLFAAAELLAREKSQDATIKLAQANKLYDRLKGQNQKVRSFTMGGASTHDPSGGRINYWNRTWAPYTQR